MAESKQHWLDRNRPPRVQITYDVETGNAIEKKEIPFVVGVLSDLGRNEANPLPKLKDRKFVEIDRDNFNDVLASTKPEITVKVDDVLKGTGKIGIPLTFTHLDDFRPERLVERIPELRKLLRARERLNDLLAKLEGNDELSAALREVMESTDALQKITAEVSKDQS
ncbi:type VI secretion system contractile sheath small subunit [Polyangium jinanense]|uniref:Type VI secretion system contractile sheath small subunit n=1 Tax=Polyangium jinanense TaxID=2829994 RepID=A0A9X3XBF9_9BACT|nr:type VI secretion system contractile sheath small subunit [Polyangium jinanense]MDC3956748.1 type VI secretion system contractile sheath small subunit [Polyangium jinanense]MDC3984811.1 type VI secretion system contractile sheath small subunit [Polyangium jinanense]